MGVMLLDSASLYYRAFFGVPDSLKAPDGTVINALRGMLDFVATLADTHDPSTLIACWDDDWRPQWRVDLLPSYKAHRLDATGAEESPPALDVQVPLIREAFELLGVPVVGAAHAEADDVIATLAHRAGREVDVVTGDRDLFQLVDDRSAIRVLYTARGVKKLDVVTDAWIGDKYGIRADQYADFATLRGDASDGIPGVAGIGEKTAASLLTRYGDLEAVLTAAQDPDSDLTPRPRRSLSEDPDAIRRMRQVVGVRTDVVDIEIPQLAPVRSHDWITFAERWGLGGASTRVVEALGRLNHA